MWQELSCWPTAPSDGTTTHAAHSCWLADRTVSLGEMLAGILPLLSKSSSQFRRASSSNSACILSQNSVSDWRVKERKEYLNLTFSTVYRSENYRLSWTEIYVSCLSSTTRSEFCFTQFNVFFTCSSSFMISQTFTFLLKSFCLTLTKIMKTDLLTSATEPWVLHISMNVCWSGKNPPHCEI